MRAAVCDDRAEDAAFVGELLTEWGQARGQAVRWEAFPSAESFLFRYAEDKVFDLLVLDIETV